jgi:hypothetical protein
MRRQHFSKRKHVALLKAAFIVVRMLDKTVPLDFALTPSPPISHHVIGDEGGLAIVVDNVLKHPEHLIDFAKNDVSFDRKDNGTGGYPGIQAPAPLNYVEIVVRGLDPLIRNSFQLSNVTLIQAECYLSLVTTPPHRLHPLQCIPHIDTAYPLQFAILHFLCPADFGGTAFYKQRQTGFEQINQLRLADYTKTRDVNAKNIKNMGHYIQSTTADYEQIGRLDAAFNRILVYKSCQLHSGIISPDMDFSSDPEHGRLTANIFVNYRQN